MASGSYTFDTTNGYIQGKVEWSSSSNGSSANTSDVSVWVYFCRTNSGYTTYGDINTYVTVKDSQQSQEGLGLNISDAYDYQTVFVKAFSSIPHNSDGSCSCTLAVSGSASGLFSFDFSTTITLDSIPRYCNITSWNLGTVTQNSAQFSWATDSPCNWGRTYLNDSSQWTDIPGGLNNASSGSITYTGMINNSAAVPSVSTLKPGTSYRLKMQLRRADSNLWTTSTNVSFTTLQIATLSLSSSSFYIGNNLTATVNNYGNNVSFLKVVLASNTSTVLLTQTDITASSITLALSGIASTLYSNCPNSTSLALKVLFGVQTTDSSGTKILKEEDGYYNTYNLTALVNSANSSPTFSTFTIANTDTQSNTVINDSSNVYMLKNLGNVRATITTANKAVSKNSATMSSYEVTIFKTGSLILNTSYNFAGSSTMTFDSGAINDVGTYTFRITAYDSRGLSTSVDKTFTVIDYIKPSLKITVTRYNSYEPQILLSLNGYVYPVTINSINKNIDDGSGGTSPIIQYQYSEVGSTLGSIITINNTSLTKNSSATPYTYTYTKSDHSDPFLTLDSEKSYNIKFYIKDKYYDGSTSALTISTTVTVAQGIPILGMYDNGYVTVGKLPDMASSSLLQVNSDIMANGRNILSAIDDVIASKSKATYSTTAPSASSSKAGDLLINSSTKAPSVYTGSAWSSWDIPASSVAYTDGSNTTNLQTYIPTLLNMFRLQKIVKMCTVSSGHNGISPFGTLIIPVGYSFVGFLPIRSGYSDNWLTSFGLAIDSNTNVQCHINCIAGAGSQYVGCYALYIRTDVFTAIGGY